MANTENIRRINNQGFVLIPQKIYRDMGLKDGDVLEFIPNYNNKEIVIRPYKKSWEDTVIEWWDKHRDEVYRYSNFSYECEYTFCVVRRPNDITRAGYAKKFYSDKNDVRIAQAAAYARAIGLSINKMIGYEG